MKIIFWWSSACRSIMPLFRELSQLNAIEVRVIIQKDIGENRLQFGWKSDSSGNAKLTILPLEKRWQIAKNILLEEFNALHIIGGYQHTFLHMKIIMFAKSQNIDYGLMAEAPINFNFGIKRWLKNIYLKTLVPYKTSLIANNSLFFICLSGKRFKEVCKVGWPLEKTYSFGYFPQARNVQARRVLPSGEPCRLLCMGTLMKYKGVDLLLHATSLATKMGATCLVEIVGDGQERRNLESLANELGIEDNVKFHGFISDTALDQLIEISDILICPGIAEPWGIRINDGIQSGLAVIASDRLGASDLVSASGAGITFRAGDVGELAEAIHTLSLTPKLVQSFKTKAKYYSQSINPKIAAKYFVEIVKYTNNKSGLRPCNPWTGSLDLPQ